MKLIVAMFACASPLALLAQATSQGRVTDPAGVRFTVRVDNIAHKALRVSTGDSADMQLSPVAWVVHRGPNPLFTPGEIDRGIGLKPLAESGRPAPLLLSIANMKSPDVHLVGFESSPLGAPRPGMLNAGQSYEFEIEARPGHRLSLVMMLAESNDGLIATGPAAIDLFDGGRAISGDVTSRLSLWDAGTEVNEDPGLGPNTGRKQGAPHAGDPERNPVRPIAEAEYGKAWPPVGRIVRITIVPKASR